MLNLDLEAYFLTIVILTTVFSMGSGIHLWYYLAGELGPSYQVDEKRDVRHANVMYVIGIFLVDLVCHCAPIYLYISAGSGEIGDIEYRFTKIIYALGIFTVIGVCNFGYKAYFYANIGWFRRAELIDNWEESKMKITHQVLFTVHALAFWAIIVGCLCALFLPGGWRSDIPSVMLFVAGILILVTSLLSFINRSSEIHHEGLEAINRARLDENFGKEGKMFSVTPTTHILSTKALDLTDATNHLKSELPNKEEIVMLGEVPINKNTVAGQLLIYTSNHFKTPNVVLRTFKGKNYGLLAEDAIELDNNFNQTAGGHLFKVGTIIPTARRVLQKISPYVQDYKRPVTDRLLDPVELNPENKARKTGYVALTRDFDLMKHGFFAFTEDVWSVAYGLGIHVNFTPEMVIPYVLFMNCMHVYFLYDTMYGNMAWAATTLVPYLIAEKGTYSQFWDMHIKCFLVGWGLIALTRAVMAPSANTFIYDNDVWNNTLYYPGMCQASCDSLDESTYFYVMTCVTLVFSIYYLLYAMMIVWLNWKTNRRVFGIEVSKKIP